MHIILICKCVFKTLMEGTAAKFTEVSPSVIQDEKTSSMCKGLMQYKGVCLYDVVTLGTTMSGTHFSLQKKALPSLSYSRARCRFCPSF